MKFKTGDHVRVIARTSNYFDETGMVAEIDDGRFPFRVAGLRGVDCLIRFGPDELILAEAPEQAASATDSVNHPHHYTNHPSGIECIQITEHMGFNLGNAIKYIWRADLKGSSMEDLDKAEWYIKREKQRRKAAK